MESTCPRCDQPVFHAERRVANGNSFHPTCFVCRVCGVGLHSTNLATHKNEVYCKTCYGRTHGPRGYGHRMTSGVMSMTMTTLQDPRLDRVVHNPCVSTGELAGADGADGAVGYLDERCCQSYKDGGQADAADANHVRRRIPVQDATLARVQHDDSLDDDNKPRLIKTHAHDNMTTSNVPVTGLARAYPRLARAAAFARPPPSPFEAPAVSLKTAARDNSNKNGNKRLLLPGEITRRLRMDPLVAALPPNTVCVVPAGTRET